MSDASAPEPRLVFELREKYLYAKVSSSVLDSDIGRNYLKAIADEIDRTEATGVMLVRDIAIEPSVGGTFHAMVGFLSRASHVRVAWVNPFPQLTEILEFAITIAINRGARFELFDEEAAAEEWLMGG